MKIEEEKAETLRKEAAFAAKQAASEAAVAKRKAR